MSTIANFLDPLYDDCVLESLQRIPKTCTVDSPAGYVDCLDLPSLPNRNNAAAKELRVSDPEILIRHLNSEKLFSRDRIFFLSQKDPRSALDTTNDLLGPIIDCYNLSSLFYDLLTSFTKNVVRTEDGYCSPGRVIRAENYLDVCYVYKYAEMKPLSRTVNGRDPWEIRKTGVYHRLDLQTMHSMWIILSPVPASLGETRLKACMQRVFEQERIATNPVYVHAVLISRYLSNWRQYCNHYERALTHLSGKVMTIDLDTNFDISHETLRQTNHLMQKLLPLRSIFTASTLVVNLLDDIVNSNHCERSREEVAMTLKNLRNEIMAHADNSTYLLDFSERIRMQASDTLNLKNQDISVQQNNQLFKLAQASANDSLSIRIITILTLIYLPFSFVATVMSMCFFEMDVSSNYIVISPQVWIYLCACVPLATVTFALWKWIMLQKNTPKWARTVETIDRTPQKHA